MPHAVNKPGRELERRTPRDRGSVLFLFPVGLVIVILLGAIAVDLGNVWLQQRRLADAADSAANDAVTFGVDQGALRDGGELVLDPVRVRSAVARSVLGHELPAATGAPSVSIGTDADGDPTIEVRLDGDVDLIFGRIVRPGGVPITAVGVAEIVAD
jgi:hypothetical protein